MSQAESVIPAGAPGETRCSVSENSTELDGRRSLKAPQTTGSSKRFCLGSKGEPQKVTEGQSGVRVLPTDSTAGEPL